jgi:hypothetical protein
MLYIRSGQNSSLNYNRAVEVYFEMFLDAKPPSMKEHSVVFTQRTIPEVHESLNTVCGRYYKVYKLTGKEVFSAPACMRACARIITSHLTHVT